MFCNSCCKPIQWKKRFIEQFSFLKPFMCVKLSSNELSRRIHSKPSLCHENVFGWNYIQTNDCKRPKKTWKPLLGGSSPIQSKLYHVQNPWFCGIFAGVIHKEKLGWPKLQLVVSGVMGVPPVIILYDRIFHYINHPAIGVPPWLWKPPYHYESLLTIINH